MIGPIERYDLVTSRVRACQFNRILNRFSADVGICDETLPLTIYDFAVGLFLVVGSIATAIISLPFTLIALLPLMCYFIKLRNMFVKTTRELKRIEGMARSPVFAMMSESLKGVRTIRCNGKMNYFFNNFESIQTAHTKAAFAFTLCSRWFAFNLDIISFVFTSVASFSAVLFYEKGWLDIQPSVIGLALTLLIQISTTNFPWIVRQSAVRIWKPTQQTHCHLSWFSLFLFLLTLFLFLLAGGH